MKKKTGQFEQQNTQRARDFSVVCTFPCWFRSPAGGNQKDYICDAAQLIARALSQNQSWFGLEISIECDSDGRFNGWKHPIWLWNGGLERNLKRTMNDQTGMNTNKPILLGLKAKKNQKLECWDHIKLFEITPFLASSKRDRVVLMWQFLRLFLSAKCVSHFLPLIEHLCQIYLPARRPLSTRCWTLTTPYLQF